MFDSTRQPTRRSLLALAGAAVATASAAPRGVRFGVRGPLPKASLRDRARIVKDAGYDGIELGNEWMDTPAETLQKELDGSGLEVSAIVGSIELLNTDLEKRAKAIDTDRRRLQMAKDLKADFLIEVPTFGPNRFQDLSPVMNAREVEERILIAELKQLAGDVERSGVTLLLEPCNRKETHFMHQQGQAARIIEAVGSPGLGILSDFYHMQLEEPDIAAALSLYGRHTRYVHGRWRKASRAGLTPLRLPPRLPRAEEMGLLRLADGRIWIHRHAPRRPRTRPKVPPPPVGRGVEPSAQASA